MSRIRCDDRGQIQQRIEEATNWAAKIRSPPIRCSISRQFHPPISAPSICSTTLFCGEPSPGSFAREAFGFLQRDALYSAIEFVNRLYKILRRDN